MSELASNSKILESVSPKNQRVKRKKKTETKVQFLRKKKKKDQNIIFSDVKYLK
jgi:hypothetical protein